MTKNLERIETTFTSPVMIYLSDDEYIDKKIKQSKYELLTTWWLHRLCTEGSGVLNIGANIGWYSILAAKVTTSSGFVLAVEPTDYAYEQLCANIKANSLSNINTLKAIVTSPDKSGSRIVLDYDKNNYSTNIFSGIRSSWSSCGSNQIDYQTNVPVDTISYGDLIDRHWPNNRKLNVVIIDVDGHESDILSEIIGRPDLLGPAFVVEFNTTRSYDIKPVDILAYFLNNNYVAYTEYGVPLSKSNLEAELVRKPYGYSSNASINLIFLPPDFLFRFNRSNNGDDIVGRSLDVCESPMNILIPRSEDSGSTIGNKLILHSGITVDSNSYYPDLMSTLLKRNKGVHEPEEEFCFRKLMERILATNAKSRPSIMELGCYWAFYTKWFLKELAHQDPIAFCVEPVASNLCKAVSNLSDSKGRILYYNDYVCKSTRADAPARLFDFDLAMKMLDENNLTLLHSDIQGFETDLFDIAIPYFERKRIENVFVSTHNQRIHEHCISRLQHHGYFINYAMPFNLSSSCDGFIYASLADALLLV